MWCTDESLSYIYFSNSWRQMISCPKKTSFLCSYIECAWQIENQFNSNPGCAWPMVSCKSRRSSSWSTTNHFSVSAAVQKLAGIRNKNIANIIMASVADSFALFLFWSPKTKTKTTIFSTKSCNANDSDCVVDCTVHQRPMRCIPHSCMNVYNIHVQIEWAQTNTMITAKATNRLAFAISKTDLNIRSLAFINCQAFYIISTFVLLLLPAIFCPKPLHKNAIENAPPMGNCIQSFKIQELYSTNAKIASAATRSAFRQHKVKWTLKCNDFVSLKYLFLFRAKRPKVFCICTLEDVMHEMQKNCIQAANFCFPYSLWFVVVVVDGCFVLFVYEPRRGLCIRN